MRKNARKQERDCAIIGRLVGYAVLGTGYVLGGALLAVGFVLALFISTMLLWSSAAIAGYDEWTDDENRARRYQVALRGFRIAYRSLSLGVGGPVGRRTWTS